MTEILQAVLSSPKDARSFLCEEFGLSLYEGVPYGSSLGGGTLPGVTIDTVTKTEEEYSFTDVIDPSLFLNDPVTGGEWCPSFSDFELFPDSFNEFPLSDPPPISSSPSSFPSTPISCTSDPLSLDDQQEINDILSSFQTPSYPQLTIPNIYNNTVAPSPPLSSPTPSPLPSPSPPPTSLLGKRSHTIETPPPSTAPTTSKRTTPAKLSSTSRKQRKKEQNKTAALRYRQKKRNELDTLLKQEEELEETNKKLKTQVDSLTTEIAYLKNLWSEVHKAKAT